MPSPLAGGVWHPRSVPPEGGAPFVLGGANRASQPSLTIMTPRILSLGAGPARTNLAGWVDQNSSSFPCFGKYNLNLTQLPCGHDPLAHHDRSHRPESAGARGDRGYLATASRCWHCVSNRPLRTSSFHYGNCRSRGTGADAEGKRLRQYRAATVDALYGATLAIEVNFLVSPVLQFCVLDRSLARIATGEDSHFAQLMIVVPLNAPLAGVHPIFKDNGWLSHGLLPLFISFVDFREA